MTDPVSLAVASVAAGLSVVLGWMFWPRAPDLDGERLFKLQLSTLLLGHIDGQGGKTQDWMDAVLLGIPYHPAGRMPERKVKGLAPGTTAVEGERALSEKLSALPDRAARWAFMYDEDELALAARLDDPADLGAAYDPAGALGPGAGWEALEQWAAGASSAFPEAVERTLGAVWVLVDGPPSEAPDVLDALQTLVHRSVRVPWAGVEGEEVVRQATRSLQDPAARAVFVGEGAGIASVLRALTADSGLRDRTLAVVSMGGELGGPEHEDWMGAWFTHHKLDTEVSRLTPYFSLQWLDREAEEPGAFGQPLAHARFPEAKMEAMTPEAVQTVDLGVLPAHSDPVLVAHGVFALVGTWVGAHKSG